MKITLGQAAKQAGISKSYLSKLIKPPVSLDVISLVASSCGYNRGEIEHRVAH